MSLNDLAQRHPTAENRDGRLSRAIAAARDSRFLAAEAVRNDKPWRLVPASEFRD